MPAGCHCRHLYWTGAFWCGVCHAADQECGLPENIRGNILIKCFYNLSYLINISVIGMIHFSSISCQSTLKNINTVCIFVDSRRNLGNMILYLRQVRWFRGQSLSIPVIQKTEDNLFFCPNTFFQYFIQLIFGICAYAGIGVIFQINLQKHQRIWIGSATFSAPVSRFLRLLLI